MRSSMAGTRGDHASPPHVHIGALVVGLAGCVVALAGCSPTPPSETARPAPAAVPVVAATVESRDVPITVTAIGSIQPSTTVAVLSQVNGQVLRIHFTEGQDVTEGQRLFTIDPRPFQAALEQAEANMARDVTQLQQAEAARSQQQALVHQAQANAARDRAQLENARVEEARYRELLARELIAREQYDQFRTNAAALAATVQADEAAIASARASAQAAEAAVASARAAIRAAQAAVANAQLQLAYTTIRAPLAGRTGNLLVHEGSVVKADDVGNPLIVINAIHPVDVAFSIPEQRLAEVKRSLAGGPLPVDASLPDRPGTEEHGALSFINNTADPATGTIQLEGRLPNTDSSLWPGQFVKVTLTLRTERGALVVPSQAIQAGQQGPYVFVVTPGLTAELRPVTPGPTVAGETVIERGLAAGERVVTQGQLRLSAGTRVALASTPVS